MPLRAVVCAVVVAGSLSMRAVAQTEPRPALTPGALVILAVDRAPALRDALLLALTDARPEMRITASRIIAVQGRVAFGPEVTQALERESDVAARSEYQRTLRVLDGGAAIERTDVRPTPFFDQMPAMRTATALYPGFLASLLQAATCKVQRGRDVAAMNVAYRPNGVVADVEFDDTTTSACRKALAGLAHVIYAETAVRPDARQWIVLPLDPGFIECADAPRVGASARIGRGSNIAEPRRTSVVQPAYPAEARAAGAKGLVILEARISPTGCVRDIVVVRSVRPTLDLSALLAVSQWRYVPATLGNSPIEVLMTLTVNFGRR